MTDSYQWVHSLTTLNSRLRSGLILTMRFLPEVRIHLFRKPLSSQLKGKNLTAECAFTNYTAGKFIPAIHSVTRCSPFIRICLIIFRKKSPTIGRQNNLVNSLKRTGATGARNYYLLCLSMHYTTKTSLLEPRWLVLFRYASRLKHFKPEIHAKGHMK